MTRERQIVLPDELWIGRAPDNDLVLEHPMVSRHHARVFRSDGQIVLEDKQSANGTFLNGRSVSKSRIEAGDLFQMGPFKIRFDGHALKLADESGGNVRLDVTNVRHLVSTPSGPKTLLHNVSFSILPHEFVAILGVSGAGKSTLLNALSGAGHVTGGDVRLNGQSLLRHPHAYRAMIGFVPQDDIIHPSLTVYEALWYAGRLRLPSDLAKAELDVLIRQVLDALGMSAHASVPIHQLSGGQRKRVSIGVELLSDPTLFLLDEPTSGLDPGLESTLMTMLKAMAGQGRTIAMITHSVANIHLCDQVVILAQGGRLAFVGKPEEALDYFGVQNFSQIYTRIETTHSPEEWQWSFENSDWYRKNVLERCHANALPSNQRQDITVSAKQSRSWSEPFRQYAILTARYFQVLRKDSRTMTNFMLQSPLVTLFVLVTFDKGILGLGTADAPNWSFHHAPALLFLMTCAALWFGTSNATQEITREQAIVERERRVNLGIVPYVLSKFSVLAVLGLLQCLFLIVILGGWFDIPHALEGPMLGLLILTTWAGTAMGLALSAWADNPVKGMSLLPILLLPQIIFSGAVLPLERMAPWGSTLSIATVGRWAYEGVGNTSQIASQKLSYTERVGQLEVPATLELATAVKAGFETPAPVSAWALILIAALSLLLCGGLLYRRMP